MELGGVVTIKCEKTGYWAELEFKLKVSAAFYSDNGTHYSCILIDIFRFHLVESSRSLRTIRDYFAVFSQAGCRF